MGCGASTTSKQEQQQAHPSGKYQPQSSHRSGTSGYVAAESADDDEDDNISVTEEELRLIAEIEKRSSVSTAHSADEPGGFRLGLRVSVVVARARLLHGINGECSDAGECVSVTAETSRKKPFGDLKPKQVKKIQDWVMRVYTAHGCNVANFEPVPERYVGQPGSGSAATPLLSPQRGSSGSAFDTSYSSDLSPRTPMSTRGGDGYPETPHRFGDSGSLANLSVSDYGTPRTRQIPVPGSVPEDDESCGGGGESLREGMLPRGDDGGVW